MVLELTLLAIAEAPAMSSFTGNFFADYEASDLRRFQQALNEVSQFMPKQLAMKLPGFIVVGDQTSGKTTVLQALSSMRHPVAATAWRSRCSES